MCVFREKTKAYIPIRIIRVHRFAIYIILCTVRRCAAVYWKLKIAYTRRLTAGIVVPFNSVMCHVNKMHIIIYYIYTVHLSYVYYNIELLLFYSNARRYTTPDPETTGLLFDCARLYNILYICMNWLSIIISILPAISMGGWPRHLFSVRKFEYARANGKTICMHALRAHVLTLYAIILFSVSVGDWKYYVLLLPYNIIVYSLFDWFPRILYRNCHFQRKFKRVIRDGVIL